MAIQQKSAASARELGLSEFFAASEARVDRWRSLHRLANALAGSNPPQTDSLRTETADLLSAMAPIEDLCGFPGPRLMVQVHDRIRTGDWTGLLRLVQRISAALLANSYRDDPQAWKQEDEGWRLLNETRGKSDTDLGVVVTPGNLAQMAFYPLTMPITTGPGTISVAIALGASHTEKAPLMLGALAASAAVSASIFLCYRYADRIEGA